MGKRTKEAKRKARAKGGAKKAAGGRQREIPGTEPKRFLDIDNAALLAHEAARAFTAAGKKREERYDVVDTLMAEHGVLHYTTPDRLVCDASSKRRVTVKPEDE